ncbi:unnamed protein product [Rhizophagus irregularis]|nr:unnamed protein product [Rhizophagus irregularis]
MSKGHFTPGKLVTIGNLVPELHYGPFSRDSDNNLKHSSRLTKEFLQENVSDIIDWPSNSPDLNPIEILWSIVKHNVEKCMPQNIDELKQFMAEEWNKIPDSFFG